MSPPIRGQDGHLLFPIDPKKHVVVISKSTFCKMINCSVMIHYFQSEARAVILFFRRPENTNLVEDVEFLLLVNLRQIPLSDFREDENVSANQRPKWQSCFSNRPKNHQLGSWRWALASCHVLANSVQRFPGRMRKCFSQSEGFQRRSRKCLSQSEANVAILLFQSAQKPPTW